MAFIFCMEGNRRQWNDLEKEIQKDFNRCLISFCTKCGWGTVSYNMLWNKGDKMNGLCSDECCHCYSNDDVHHGHLSRFTKYIQEHAHPTLAMKIFLELCNIDEAEIDEPTCQMLVDSLADGHIDTLNYVVKQLNPDSDIKWDAIDEDFDNL